MTRKCKAEIKKILKPLGQVWWDFDGQMNVGVEAVNTPYDRNFLFTMKDSRSKTKQKKEGSAKLCDIAWAITQLINETTK